MQIAGVRPGSADRIKNHAAIQNKPAILTTLRKHTSVQQRRGLEQLACMQQASG
jgi:hypothetical protein